jgi:hypothetical protein
MKQKAKENKLILNGFCCRTYVKLAFLDCYHILEWELVDPFLWCLRTAN